MDLPSGEYRLRAAVTLVDMTGVSSLFAEVQVQINVPQELASSAISPTFVPLDLVVCPPTPTSRDHAATEPVHGLKG